MEGDPATLVRQLMPFMNADHVGPGDLGDHHVAPGVPSTHGLGVCYTAPWEYAADGFSEHARRCAVALSQAGCPLVLRSVRGVVEPDKSREALEQEMWPLLSASIGSLSAHVYQVVLYGDQWLYSTTMHRFMDPEVLARVNAAKVVYSVFERDRVSKTMADGMARFGQVWTACEMNREMLIRSGVPADKLRIVHVPFFPNDPLLAMRAKPRVTGVPRFGHIGKWEPRKAQDRILEAFMLAFRPCEAVLIMRCGVFAKSVAGYPEHATEALGQLLGREDIRAQGWTAENVRADGIQIIGARLSRESLVKLHGFLDAYVTLSRGEGFDMPALDAKIAGRMLVYVPSGGPQDFASPSDIRVEASGTVPCHPWYKWEPDACYLDYRIEDAVRAFREAAQRIRSTGGARDPEPEKLGEYTAKAVGEAEVRHLTELLAPLGMKPWPDAP